MSFTEHYFQTEDGPKIHYRDYPAVGEERGLPVLCLHGLTRNVNDFAELAPQIAALGRRVIVASQRGRGKSDWDPRPERYQPPIYTMDMAALLENLGIARAVYVGTSMGGLMSLITPTLAPGKLAAAVINDIGVEINPGGIERIKSNVSARGAVKTWDEAIDRTIASNLDAFPKRKGDREFWDWFARKLWIEVEGGFDLSYDQAIVEKFDEGGELPDLWPFWEPFKALPVLVVRGGNTDLLTIETVDRMRSKKPGMAYTEVPDVGHAPFMTEPEAWSAITDFLEQVD
ncbi:alpha/beta fold hydrolase [Maricaulis sp. MIT060901]|uniref:alpha/beta fold hydrolase n=1 Tax=Maricaulis sp. MIT060901 TaxID=3096993 RepID=UPI003999A5D7